MKFLECNGSTSGSYHGFTFTKHNESEVIYGDQIWSNGKMVEISDGVDSEELEGLIEMTSNKGAFRGALLRCGFDV